MTDINIYTPNSELWGVAPITQDAERQVDLMKTDKIVLTWKSNKGDVIPVGAYISYENLQFRLTAPYYPDTEDNFVYVYKPEFVSRIMQLVKVPLLYEVEGIVESDFTFTGGAAEVKTVIEKAINAAFGELITLEFDADLTDKVLILSFSNVDILSALNTIAEQLECEWWYAGNTISFKKIFINGAALSLTAGVNVSVPNISNKTDFFNRFYVFGSTRNIAQDYNGANANTIIKKRLTLDPERHPNGYFDLPKFDNNGNVILSSDGSYTVDDSLAFGIYTKVLQFDDIYPHSDLAVSSVVSLKRYSRDANDKKINIGTSSNPVYDYYNIYFLTLKDGNNNNFIINPTTYNSEKNPTGSLIKGLVLSLHFKSGMLSGREFEANFHDKQITKRDDDGNSIVIPANSFEIIMIQDNAINVPNATIKPLINDAVIAFNIRMPNQYVQAAYNDLEQKALIGIYEQNLNADVFSVDSNQVWFYENAPNITIGRHISFLIGNRVIDTRVTAITAKLDNNCEQTITLSKSISKGTISTLVTKLEATKQNIATIEIEDDREKQDSISKMYSARRELQEQIFDTDGYFESGNIKPLSIETSMLSVGAKSRDFALKGLTFYPNHLGRINRIFVESKNGCLIHYSIEDEVRTWNIPQIEIDNISNNSNYVYAHCSKSGSGGNIVVTEEQITVDHEEDYYNFLIGILSSVTNPTEGNQYRFLNTVFGSTQISGRNISTGRITSNDDNTYFDLDEGKFFGKFSFTDNSGNSVEVFNGQVLADKIVIKDGNNEIGYISGRSGDDVINLNNKFAVKRSGETYISNGTYKTVLTPTQMGSVSSGLSNMNISNVQGSVSAINLTKTMNSTGSSLLFGTSSLPGNSICDYSAHVSPSYTSSYFSLCQAYTPSVLKILNKFSKADTQINDYNVTPVAGSATGISIRDIKAKFTKTVFKVELYYYNQYNSSFVLIGNVANLSSVNLANIPANNIYYKYSHNATIEVSWQVSNQNSYSMSPQVGTVSASCTFTPNDGFSVQIVRSNSANNIYTDGMLLVKDTNTHVSLNAKETSGAVVDIYSEYSGLRIDQQGVTSPCYSDLLCSMTTQVWARLPKIVSLGLLTSAPGNYSYEQLLPPNVRVGFSYVSYNSCQEYGVSGSGCFTLVTSYAVNSFAICTASSQGENPLLGYVSTPRNRGGRVEGIMRNSTDNNITSGSCYIAIFAW